MKKFLSSEPSGYGQLIRRSINLYNAGFTKVFSISLVLAIIVFIPRFISDFAGHDIFAGITLFNPNRLWLLLLDFFELIFFIAITWHMYCVMIGIREPFIQDLSIGLKKFFYVFIATLIQSAILISVVLLFIKFQVLLHHYEMLPVTGNNFLMTTGVILVIGTFFVLYLSTIFVFLIPLIAIENKGIISSLAKSCYLSWNHWWRVFSVQLTPWICYFFILYFIKFALRINIHIYLIEHGTHPLWTTILNMFVFAVFIPWVPATLLVQLKDLEIRKKYVSATA